MIEKKPYPLDLINRIAHNASIGTLYVRVSVQFYYSFTSIVFKFRTSDELSAKFSDLIQEFTNIGELTLDFLGYRVFLNICLVFVLTRMNLEMYNIFSFKNEYKIIIFRYQEKR